MFTVCTKGSKKPDFWSHKKFMFGNFEKVVPVSAIDSQTLTSDDEKIANYLQLYDFMIY